MMITDFFLFLASPSSPEGERGVEEEMNIN